MKILFFSPHAYFSVHALPEAIVAETLGGAGHEIYMVTCNGIYRKHCLCMSNVDFDDQIKKGLICMVCKSNRDSISKEFRFHTLRIESYLSHADAVRAETVTKALDRVRFLQFEWDGIAVARYALYEFWLNHKLSSEDIDPSLWPEYLAIFENAMKTLLAAQRIVEELNPDRIITYNSLYSVNRVVAALADRKSTPHFSLHAGRHHKRRLQHMTIYKGIGYDVILNRLPAVEAYRVNPCTIRQVDIVTEHVRELFEASSMWVYSTKSGQRSSNELLDHFGVKEGQKVLLAVMRSGDERQAARYAGVGYFNGDPLFADQYEWLSWLVEFAKNHTEFVIIFRVHPREFPNKRESVTSQNAYAFINFIDNLKLPANVHINLPHDNLSLHDLLKISDVLLNNTSTAGLEASLFGIPVVGIRDEHYAFDLALQEEPESIADYIAKITAASELGWSFARVIGAYRWLNYLFNETEIDISDGYDPGCRTNTFSGHVAHLILRKLGTVLNLGGGLNEIHKRSRPIANNDKLAYAILNNQDSHIGVFPMEPAGYPRAELERVKQAYQSVMDSIRDPEDAVFLAKVDACLNSSAINHQTQQS